MAYGEYADSGRSCGKCLYQLSKIGIPLHIVESVIFRGDYIAYSNKEFATVKWAEDDTPIFIFKGEFAHYNKNINQPKAIILMGSNNETVWEEVGCFIDAHGLAFKEASSKYSKFYLADIEGKPLREQVLTTTTFEDKFSRLKNKFATREIKY